jgi:hypothetical protein
MRFNKFSHHVNRILLLSYEHKLPQYINIIAAGLVARALVKIRFYNIPISGHNLACEIQITGYISNK